jgi:hypothetical protein
VVRDADADDAAADHDDLVPILHRAPGKSATNACGGKCIGALVPAADAT